MKSNKLFLILLIFTLFCCKLTANAFQDSLIVKVKTTVKQINLNDIFGRYQFSNLIRPALLNYANFKTKIKVNQIQKNLESLSRIYVLKYDSRVPKIKLLNSLMNLNYFEYVEDFPERHIEMVPNDSLFFEQYYMDLLNVTQAWDSITTKRQIIIGVVDTGVDYDHPDLSQNIWNNPGEIGLDNNGNEKNRNGIDDDNNGFIDDWHGWDFDSDSLGQDNDPFPGHGHGTHVSGTMAAIINNSTGIAGMCDSIKIIPLKTASDSPFGTSMQNTYEAIIYAAKMGADLINCSWGGSSKTETEQEVINTAISLGTAIIAAAGNNSQDGAFYPAAYDGVISVAATDQLDLKASFSNYNSTVDVAAPGVSIISTTPWNSYSSWAGTSMASPIACGVAAMIKMVHPEYTPLQIGEHLKATCKNLDSINPEYSGKLGKGRVDALRAVTEKNPKSIRIIKLKVENEASSERFQSNQKCFVSIDLENLLSTLKNFNIKVRAIGNSDIVFSPNKLDYGTFEQYKTISIKKGLEFTIPEINELDYRIELEFYFLDNDESINQASISFIVNPSYLTFDNNLIKTTFNSRGNIGYNDYPSNEQGIGFNFNSGPNILYEGSLMISSDTLLADVARNALQSSQNTGLVMQKNIDYLPLMNPALLAGTTEIVDNPLSVYPTGIKINQLIYQQKVPNNVIYSVYDIINNKNQIQDSIYLGLYFDWDIGISGTDNKTYWDKETNSAIIYNTKIDSLPKIAVKMLSNFQNNYWAIDNDGTTSENPGVWDGFIDAEKIRMLKSEIGRDSSGITDVSVVLSAGPIFLDRNDTARISFAIIADKDFKSLNKSIEEAVTFANLNKLDNATYNLPISQTRINKIFPNPCKYSDLVNITFELENTTEVEIDVWDLLGNKIGTILSGKYNSGKYIRSLFLGNLSVGTYLVHLKTNSSKSIYPIIIYK